MRILILFSRREFENLINIRELYVLACLTFRSFKQQNTQNTVKRSVLNAERLVKSNSIPIKPMNQRSLILFHSAIKSEKTKHNYDLFLEQFKKYFILKDFDSLLSIDSKKLQIMVEDYVLYQRNRNMSYGLISGMVGSLSLFFSMNDRTLNWQKIKKMLPERTKPTGDKPYTTEQIRQILKNTTNLKFKAMINFMASSGVRIGSFEEMRMKDLEDYKDGCKSVKVYADSREEYYTFIHAEAIQALEDYFESRKKKGEKITSDSWVFSKTSDPTKPSPTMNAVSSLSRFINKALSRTRTKKRFDIMATHGLRKRFATVLKSNKDLNLSISEKLMGHSTTVKLDNCYFKPTLDVMFDEYRKAIPELVIDESARLRLELQKKDEKLASLESKDKRIELLEDTISRLETNFNELKSRF